MNSRALTERRGDPKLQFDGKKSSGPPGNSTKVTCRFAGSHRSLQRYDPSFCRASSHSGAQGLGRSSSATAFRTAPPAQVAPRDVRGACRGELNEGPSTTLPRCPRVIPPCSRGGPIEVLSCLEASLQAEYVPLRQASRTSRRVNGVDGLTGATFRPSKRRTGSSLLPHRGRGTHHARQARLTVRLGILVAKKDA